MKSGVVLAARLDSAAAVALAEDLGTRLGHDVEIDAGEVTHFGALALQTLVVAAAHWRTAGREFLVTNIPPEIRTQIADLGMTDLTPLTGDMP